MKFLNQMNQERKSLIPGGNHGIVLLDDYFSDYWMYRMRKHLLTVFGVEGVEKNRK